jgi:DNA-binding MarR family transcriptional regulator
MAFIALRSNERGEYSATYRDLAAALDTSISVIQRCIDILEARGYLRREASSRRSAPMTFRILPRSTSGQ